MLPPQLDSQGLEVAWYGGVLKVWWDSNTEAAGGKLQTFGQCRRQANPSRHLASVECDSEVWREMAAQPFSRIPCVTVAVAQLQHMDDLVLLSGNGCDIGWQLLLWGHPIGSRCLSLSLRGR